MDKLKELEEALERSIKAYEDMFNSPYGIHELVAEAMENKITRIENEIKMLKGNE